MRTRTINLSLGLLLLTAATGLAQIPRTINYQGRAVDPDGPVTGERTVTLSIYQNQTGGSALFTESQLITFDANGTFTAVIGGGTTGGIPESVDFSGEYWFGMAISDFNGGQELPRLRFHASPYSLNSVHADMADQAENANTATSATTAESADFADSTAKAFRAESAATADETEFAARAGTADSALAAQRADSAAYLKVPLQLSLQTGDKPTLEVINLGTTPAISAHAENGPAVSATGFITTSKYLEVRESSGPSGKPRPGELYRDNVPVAHAAIDSKGTLIQNFGIAGVNHDTANPGIYEIALDNRMATITVDQVDYPAVAPVVTLGADASGVGLPAFATYGYKFDKEGNLEADKLVVTIQNIEGQLVNRPFSLVVFGRPQ